MGSLVRFLTSLSFVDLFQYRTSLFWKIFFYVSSQSKPKQEAKRLCPYLTICPNCSHLFQACRHKTCKSTFQLLQYAYLNPQTLINQSITWTNVLFSLKFWILKHSEYCILDILSVISVFAKALKHMHKLLYKSYMRQHQFRDEVAR